MRTGRRVSPSLLFLSVFSVLLLSASAARAAEPPAFIPGVPAVGAPGVGRNIGEIMQLQRTLDLAGLSNRTVRKPEEEVTWPDRTGLPQNPASPDVAAFGSIEAGLAPGSGGGPALSPQTVGTTFLGATLSGTNPTYSFPPDCMGTVGPSQYVVFVNGRLVTFDKSTGIADGVLNADADVFFSSVANGSYTSDPRIRYDRFTGRWFLVIINVSTPNRILIAVSDAASAGVISGSTVFTFFYIDIAATPPTISNTCLADYPTLGLDANALYIGANNFCGASLSFNSTDGYVVRKSSILGAGPLVVTVFRGLVASASAAGPYTPQGVDNYDPASNEGYFIGVDNATFGTLMMRRVSNPGGTPSISSNISITVPTTTFPLTVNHLGNTGGTSGKLDALDDRLFAAHIRNGRLWTAHNIGVTNTGSTSGTRTRDGSRWYELNVPAGSGTPTVVQSGTVFTASATNTTTERNYWIPSIMVSGQGHAALGFSTAGSNERANAATVGRLAGDAAGAMQTPTLYTASSTAYNPPSDPGGASGRRWGDYSYTSLDPLDDMTMWTVQEFCNAANSYGVQVAKLVAPPPATPTTLADVNAGDNPVNLTLTGVSASGSGYYDPGADLPGVPAFHHLAVSITSGAATGTPPAVVSAAYVDPTTIDLVLDASAATANLPGEMYTLTVTNPDGQTASAAIVHVTGSAPLPEVVLAAGPSANEADGALAFTVQLSAASALPVTVYFATGDSTATVADGDYAAAVDSIVIAPGAVSDTIVVTVLDDATYEADEFVKLALTGATGATLGATTTATGTILNDDAPPTVSIDDLAIAEGDAGTTAFSFTVSLSAASGLAVTVDAATADSSATLADGDYQSAAATLTFNPGDVAQPFVVQANGDVTEESDELFRVLLGNLSGATFGDSLGLGTIVNDDMVPALSIDDVTLAEGNSGTTGFVFTVSLSNPTTNPVSVLFATADGTAALADGDYLAAADTLVIPAGFLTDTLRVEVAGDLCGEPDEDFTVVLSEPLGAVLADSVGVGTIVNDDDAAAPAVTVLQPNGGETLEIGAQVDIQWSALDSVGVVDVDICLSRDGGATFPEVLASAVPNSGTFSWTVTGPDTPGADAFIRVKAHDAGCNTGSDDSDAGFRIAAATTGVLGTGPILDFALGLARPNPTNGATQIEFQLPREAHVTLVVVDAQGREVAVLADGDYPEGRHVATWDGRTPRGPAAMGVYFIRYEGGGKAFSRRLVLAR